MIQKYIINQTIRQKCVINEIFYTKIHNKQQQKITVTIIPSSLPLPPQIQRVTIIIIDTIVKITNKNHANENRNTKISVREADLGNYHQYQFQYQLQHEHKKYHYFHEHNLPRQTFSLKIKVFRDWWTRISFNGSFFPAKYITLQTSSFDLLKALQTFKSLTYLL